MRILLLAGCLAVAVAAPALAQLPPAPPGALGNAAAGMGPTGMGQGPLVPGYAGQQTGALYAAPAGAGIGPNSFGDPAGQGRMTPDPMNGLDNGPTAPGAMGGPTVLNGGVNRQ